jgi:hypothetical protein
MLGRRSNISACKLTDKHMKVSPYSYFALLYLNKNRDALRKHGVEVE